MSGKKHGTAYWLLIGWWWELLVLWFKAMGWLIKGIVKLINYFLSKAQDKRDAKNGVFEKPEALKKYEPTEGIAPIVNVPSFDVSIPRRKDGCPLAYDYSQVSYKITDVDAVKQCIETGKWNVTPVLVGNEVHFIADEKDVGICTDRDQMVKDWIQNKEPLLIYLDRLAVDNDTVQKATVFMAFYRDRRKNQEWREQSVVTLTKYKNDDAQSAMSQLEPGDPVELKDDVLDDSVGVSGFDGLIGYLPKKYAEKVNENGCFGAFVEKIEEIESETFDLIYKPIVRIYW